MLRDGIDYNEFKRRGAGSWNARFVSWFEITAF
jgi:hypothetical protein